MAAKKKPKTALRSEQLDLIADGLFRLNETLERVVMLGEHALSIIKFGKGRASMPISVPLECPDCGQSMQWKVTNAGDIFGGCKNFPVCRATRPYDAKNSKLPPVYDPEIPF